MLEGALKKLEFDVTEPVAYRLCVGEDTVALNDHVGLGIRIRHTGLISCANCSAVTKKSYGGGYCYPCFKSLARCDLCFVSPARCHFHLGTCREPDFGETICMTGHCVYLANSCGLKVGLTRGDVPAHRWIEQGAMQGIALAQAATRRQAGLLEDVIAKHVADKTDWRGLVTGATRPIELALHGERIRTLVAEEFDRLDGVAWLPPAEQSFSYPVDRYPRRAMRLRLRDDGEVVGRLLGIIGSFLLFEHGAFNIAEHNAYHVEVEFLGEDVKDHQMELF